MNQKDFIDNISHTQVFEDLFSRAADSSPAYRLVRHCFDMIEAFIAVMDPAGKIRLMNEKAGELLDCRNEEIIGDNFIKKYIIEEQQEEIQELFRKSREDSGHAPKKEYRLRTSGKHTKTIRLRNTAINDRNKKVIGILISGSDVTSEVRNSESYKTSMDKAEELNRMKSDFISNVIHDIRTPLNAIMGFTEQMMQTDLEEQQREFLKIIDKSSEHLLSLVNDILVLSKIEAQEMKLEEEPFKLSYPVDYVYKALRAKAEEKGLHFSHEMDSRLDSKVLIGDTFRLRQILINMLNNAIKFTPRGSVEIKCSLKSETKTKIRVGFEIKDTGIGIAPEKLDDIFEQFRQADSTITKNYGGTGLGLTICKQLIEKMGGSLSVSSQEGIGTTFSFIIPYKKGKETDLMPEDLGTVDSEKLRGRKVLLVDDDSVNRLLGKTMLEKFSCDIEIANSGEEAIEKIKRSRYEIILLDIHMPDVNGIDVVRFLREKNRDRKTKVIAVTAAAMRYDVTKFYEAGCDDFIIKPFKELYLFNKMCQALQIQTRVGKIQAAEIILKEAKIKDAYNLSELKKMAGGDREFINQMLITFIENTENTIHLLTLLLREKNWEQIGETAHKVLPSYRHLEVEDVISRLERIKTKALVHPDYNAIPALVRSVVEDMKQLVTDLKREIEG